MPLQYDSLDYAHAMKMERVSRHHRQTTPTSHEPNLNVLDCYVSIDYRLYKKLRFERPATAIRKSSCPRPAKLPGVCRPTSPQ
jgi:hypothetical protein